MPTFIRLKLLEEPEDATIQELCTKARQKLILRELCPVHDWSRDGFNEMSSENSKKNFSRFSQKCLKIQTPLKTELMP